MGYELRVAGAVIGTFDQPEAAVEAARLALRSQPDSEPEIIDTATGKPFAPAASRGWREYLANKIGF